MAALAATPNTGSAQTSQVVVTSDIRNFWAAHDAIVATSDSAAQYLLLDSLFFRPGSAGLHALIQRRGYTPQAYVQAIREYPEYWASVRANMLRAGEFGSRISDGVARLASLYPPLRPASVYFTVGALRTSGTTMDSLVLLGSELALGDSKVRTDELPRDLGHNLRRYFDTNPIDDVVFLGLHEYVHTQQGQFGDDLLAVALQEGVAEFTAVLAGGTPSPTPAVSFGRANAERVRRRFGTEMFSPRWNDWLYNDFANEFGVRDLGYYVGFAIAEGYYAQASNKTQALIDLIEIDYTSPAEVTSVVNKSRYFAQPVEELRADYEANRPRLTDIAEFQNGAHGIDPSTTRLTLTFSASMNTRFRGFDYGPLGESNVLRVTRVIGWSDDRMKLSLEIELRPNLLHQLMLTSQFRDDEGRTIEPILIEVATGGSGSR